MEIYVVFSKTGTLFSRMLSRVASFKYMHTSLSFNSNLSEMYSFGRLNPRNPLLGGFVKENIQDGVYQLSPHSEIKVYRMQLSSGQAAQLKAEIANFEHTAREYKYNLIGLLFIPFKVRYVRKRYYFCSQFVSELFVKIAILDQSIAPEWTSPEDLINVLDMELVYEGFIHTYPYLLNQPNGFNYYDHQAYDDR